MAATQTVAQASPFRKSGSGVPLRIKPTDRAIPSVMRPRRGVIVLYGYGSSVRVERGHLIVEDGIGSDRFKGRFSRVGHGLERLVVVGANGIVSLAAVRWLADQNASFVMLERDGTVLATTGPVRPSDVRLRRAQALAHQSGAAFRISRELIDRKLAGQERVVRQSLADFTVSKLIHEIRSELAEVETIDAIRSVEPRAARVYWKAWQGVPINFPEKDLPRVPEHWRSFDTRASTLSGSPRLAANPVNSILNYLYALLEAECRLACATLGLDPEMGVLHMDKPTRDSFACDLMEAIRPEVDAYVLNWITRQPLKRSWFFEERNGNCRLMADLATQLAETTSTWARLVAPVAEWAMKEIASTTRTRKSISTTRLTQNHRRAVSGGEVRPEPKAKVRQPNMCNVCGSEIARRQKSCLACSLIPSTERITAVAAKGLIASHTPEAQAKRSKKHHALHTARRAWSASDQPDWLTQEFYLSKMQPKLAAQSSRGIARELHVSRSYAIQIRHGRVVPHPRHWQALAKLLMLPK
ncbi:CRISPR-associated endonuclease Cas1 [Granulicella sp. L46]|uniref:CRISPR-associated endonuclease Cas1 n=1 Tax=Granulicella sp. L46 TaxID=1641865 RepID=UPI00131CC970|nr:CRISPR-associated endonuclease Cas1 [Granulicella sp. L46]